MLGLLVVLVEAVKLGVYAEMLTDLAPSGPQLWKCEAMGHPS
jgi:hypothetical protein